MEKQLTDFVEQAIRNVVHRVRRLEIRQDRPSEIYEVKHRASYPEYLLTTAAPDLAGMEIVLPPGAYLVTLHVDVEPSGDAGQIATYKLKLNGVVLPDTLRVSLNDASPSYRSISWIVTLWDYRQYVLRDNPNVIERFHEWRTYTNDAAESGTFQGKPQPLQAPLIAGYDMDGQPTYSMLFDGVADYISGVGGTTPFYSSSGALEIWFQTSSATVQYLCGNVTPSAPTGVSGKGAGMYINASGKVVAGLAISGGATVTLVSTSTLNDGRPHHVVMTWTVASVPEGSPFNLYIDGVLEATGTAITPTHGGAPVPPNIGATTSAANFFNGYLDEYESYTSLLTAIQAKEHYDAGTGVIYYPATLYEDEVASDVPGGWWPLNEPNGSTTADDSGNNNVGTLNGGILHAQPGAIIVGTDGQYDNAFHFDGSTSYVSIPHSSSINPSGALSYGAWVKFDTLVGTQYIMEKLRDGGLKHFFMHWLTAANRIRIGYHDGVTTRNYDFPMPSYIATGAWYHLMAVFDGANANLYLNGGALPNFAQTGTPQSGTTGSLILGADGTHTTGFLSGLLDEADVYLSALSAARVKEHYLTGKSNRGFLTVSAQKDGGAGVSSTQFAKLTATRLFIASRS